MTESYLCDADLNALSGTSDPRQEVLFPAIGESPYYTSFYKMLYRLLEVARRAGDLRVYKDDAGELSFGVRAGRLACGLATVSFAGAAGQPLADDATNSIYLSAEGALTVSQEGFPDPAQQPHLPLAVIATGSQSAAGVSGRYAPADITDGRILNRLPQRGLTDGSVGAADLAGALTAMLPQPAIQIGEQVEGARTLALQVRDAAGADLAGRFRLRVWLATADFGAPDATDNTVTLGAGTLLRTVAQNADYELVTDATGAAQLAVSLATAGSRYLLAEIDGRIVSSGAIAWTA